MRELRTGSRVRIVERVTATHAVWGVGTILYVIKPTGTYPGAACPYYLSESMQPGNIYYGPYERCYEPILEEILIGGELV